MPFASCRLLRGRLRGKATRRQKSGGPQGRPSTRVSIDCRTTLRDRSLAPIRPFKLTHYRSRPRLPWIGGEMLYCALIWSVDRLRRSTGHPEANGYAASYQVSQADL
jgi:hypothetical protein